MCYYTLKFEHNIKLKCKILGSDMDNMKFKDLKRSQNKVTGY